MKAVLISIQPQWCELIASGRKTIEVRKTRPKIEKPFKCYVYCSKGRTFLYKNPNNGELFLDSNGGYRGGDYEDRFLTGKVIGEFVCDEIYVRPANGIYYGKGKKDYLDLLKSACMTEIEALDYMGGQFNRDTYFWHISDLQIYDKPKELGEFRKPCNHINDCCTCKEAEFQYDGDELRGLICKREIPLTRPPQSWCYVEELE